MLKRKSNIDKKIKRAKKKLLLKIKKHKTILIIATFVIIFLIWVKISYSKYIDNKKNIINTVYFDKYIINNNQLTWVINFIENTFSWTNSVENKILWYKTEKENILNKYKYLKNINIQLIDNKTIKVWLNLRKTKINFIWSWKIYWVYNKNLIKKFNINNISGLNLLYTWLNNLYLPKYLIWKKLENIFFKVKLQIIIDYTDKIKQLFKNAKLYYLAWWESIKVETKQKIYFFSLTKDIQKQINQLNMIKQQIPWKFKEAKVIDLWNLDYWIYLKKTNIWK